MRKTVHRLARLVPLIAVVAALMVPMAVAAADTSIQPLSATLVARGAEVDVTVSFTCPAGYTVGSPYGMSGGASVYLQQAVTKTEQASGSGLAPGKRARASRRRPWSRSLRPFPDHRFAMDRLWHSPPCRRVMPTSTASMWGPDR